MANFFTNLIRGRDNFPASVGFIHRGHDQHKSISIGLLVIFAYIVTALICYKMIWSYIQSETIISKQEIKKIGINQKIPINLNEGMMFAIGVEELDLRYEKAFNFRLSRIYQEFMPRNRTRMRREIEIKLVPCTPNAWYRLGLSYEYELYSINQMFCPEPFVQMNISEIQGLRFEIEQCKQTQKSPSNITQYEDSLNGYFTNFNTNNSWNNYYQEQYDFITHNPNINYSSQFQYGSYGQPNINPDGTSPNTNDDDDTQGIDVQADLKKVSSQIPTYESVPCYFDFYKDKLKKFRINFLYANTLINTDLKQDYVKKYVEKQELLVELTKSAILRKEASMEVNSYKVRTNFNRVFKGFALVDNFQQLKGVASFDTIKTLSQIYDIQKQDFENDPELERRNNFVTIDIMGTGKLFEINRSYPDLFALLTDIWAQTGLTMSGLAFLIFSFNNFKLNLDIVRNLYYKKKKQPLQIQRSKVHYFRYFAYLITTFFRKIFYCCSQSKEFNNWNQAEQSFEKVFDYRHMAIKQQILEKACISLLGEHTYFSLYLQQPPNLENENKIFLLQKTTGQLRRKLLRQKAQAQASKKLDKLNAVDDKIPDSAQKIDRNTEVKSTTNLNKNYMDQGQEVSNPQSNGQTFEMEMETEDFQKIDPQSIKQLKTYLLDLDKAVKTDDVVAKKIRDKIDQENQEIRTYVANYPSQ